MEYANGGRRLGQAALREAPPHWAVVAVKICVAGILLMPLGVPVLMTAASPFLGSHAEGFRMVASGVSIALWLAMLACAEFLTTHFPPVPSR
jgi:hypothetical protein